MKSNEELEWARASNAHKKTMRGPLAKIAVSIVVAVAVGAASFGVASALWDRHEAFLKDAKADGIHFRNAESSTALGFVLVTLVPLVAGAAGFFTTFRLVGGKLPEEYKRGLKAITG